MDNSVFFRLKNERLRLNLGQSDIAKQTDVSVKTVQRWEKEIAIPSDKLALLSHLGVDVYFVLTGMRSVGALPTDEVLILEKYRQADTTIKNKMLMLLLSGNETTNHVVDNNKSINNGVQIGHNSGKVFSKD